MLNDPDVVRPATRARVLAAIDELGYRRNLAARALVTGRTQTLGVVTFDTTLYGPASTLYGIEQAAAREHYSVTVAWVSAVGRTLVQEAISRLVGQGLDGVIMIVPLLSAADAIAGLPYDIPLVAVEGDPGIGIPVVMCDQFTGAKQATEHLLRAGHDTVWHVSGPPDWTETEGRVQGWRAALEAAHAEIPPPIRGDWSPRSGYDAGGLLARMPDVTAVFAADDQMALGLIRAFTERGRRIPHDVSIVGFDDIPKAAYFTPPLTTIRQDFALVGRNALRLLIDQINTDDRTATKVLIDGTSSPAKAPPPKPEVRGRRHNADGRAAPPSPKSRARSTPSVATSPRHHVALSVTRAAAGRRA